MSARIIHLTPDDQVASAIMWNACFEAGQEAAMAGKSLLDNPFGALQFMQCRAWREGFQGVCIGRVDGI